MHRLDRDSSGVVVFAKGAGAKRALMSRWNDLVRTRRYAALVEGEMDGGSGVLDTWLRENRAGTVYETPPGAPGALRSVTRWRVLGSGGGWSLLELELVTGRRHQIRAQLSAAGHPVAGDSRYGARTNPAGRLALHAVSIELERPFGGGSVLVESKTPECFLRPLRGGEKKLYYVPRREGHGPSPESVPRTAPQAESPSGAQADRPNRAGPGTRTPGGGRMKEKNRQGKEPKKKAQKTLKEKRKDKKEKAASKPDE